MWDTRNNGLSPSGCQDNVDGRKFNTHQKGLVMVLSCNCKHEYQNDVYGKQKRVHNEIKKGKDGPAM